MNRLIEELLKSLNLEQQEACICMQNYLLTACPGSGKTRTIIYRLAYLSLLFPDSRLKNVAITYTNRAANEISERVENLGIFDSSIWTGTIHQFCLEFIIKPYGMYSERLKKGYRIIDDFVQKKYIKDICDSLGIPMNKHDILGNLSNSVIKKEYDKILLNNKEIDFNDILNESDKLLKTNDFIKSTVAQLFRTVQVDEYQDTTHKQYEILKDICGSNANIIISFIGDINQAIYRNIGGVALTDTQLSEMFNTKFLCLSLNNCYRSTQRLIDYYSQYQVFNEGIESLSDIKNEHGVIKLDKTISKDVLVLQLSKIIEEEVRNGVKENEICILAPQWWMIFDMGKKLRELLPNINFDSPELTPVKYDPLNPYYLLTRLLFTDAGKKVRTRKRMARDMLSFFSNDYGIIIPESIIVADVLKLINSTSEEENGISMLKKCISNLFEFFGITSDTHEINQSYNDFFARIDSRLSTYNLDDSTQNFRKCFREKEGVVLSTYHGAKGEEYDVLIATGLLFGYIPNYSAVYDKTIDEMKEAKLLVYVACSRARRNLYMFSEQGRYTSKGAPYTALDLIKNPNS